MDEPCSAIYITGTSTNYVNLTNTETEQAGACLVLAFRRSNRKPIYLNHFMKYRLRYKFYKHHYLGFLYFRLLKRNPD